MAVGWNITNVGAVADPLADAYGVGLGVVGLFTTSLFLVHALVQIPGGQTADRHGARPVALVSLVVMTAGNVLLLAAPEPAAAVALRGLVGLGTGVAFVAASDYVRAAGGGAAAQGIFGGSAMGGGGLALAVVPALHGPLGWRAPYASAAVAASVALLALLATARPPRARPAERSGLRAVVGDRRLDRLAVAHMASLGLNAVVANWVVTLLERAGGYSLAAAGAASALTLGAGVVGRPLGGWLAHRDPRRARAVVATSLLAGAAGTALLLPAGPLALVLFASSLVGLGAGLAFAPLFAAAAALRPEGPGAAVGFVNMAGNLVIVVGTPLLGLAFALPGDGRLGFAAVAVLWAAAVFALPRASELPTAPAGAARLPKPRGRELR
ncbi:MAG TPA: MFS transporter [Gaiellaceae bacterium]|nr:MFS transporter [Gaiellaceae bacterium]